MRHERLPTAALDSWLNGALSGHHLTEMFGPQAWTGKVSGSSLLGHAVQRNRQDLVNEALDQTSDPNVADEEGVTPLRMAVLRERTAIFERLLVHPHLDRQGGTSDWKPGDDLPVARSYKEEAGPIFFPAMAFDLGRYGSPRMAHAWARSGDPAWDALAPLPIVMMKRGNYHTENGENLGHALDAALLHNRPKMATWLLEHTGLVPSLGVLRHGHAYDPTYRHHDEAPLAPHPTMVLAQALNGLPGVPKARLGAVAQGLKRSGTPWTMAEEVAAVLADLRLRLFLAQEGLDAPAARRTRQRL